MEMRSMKKHFLVLVFWAVLSLAILEQSKATPFEKWQIHVVNGLSNAQNLYAHCQSKDDDLGPHNLTVGTEINWSFRVNIFDTTRFECYLRKPNNQSLLFDVFWIEKTSIWLFYRCYKFNCIWTAKDDGVYLRNNQGPRDVVVHKWN